MMGTPRVLYVHDGKCRMHGVDLVVYHQLRALIEAGLAVELIARGSFDIPGLVNHPMRWTPANALSWTPYEIYYSLQRRWAGWRAGLVLKRKHFDAVVGFNYVMAALPSWVNQHSMLKRVVNAPNQHHQRVPQHTLQGGWPRLTVDYYDRSYEAADWIVTLSENALESYKEAGIPDEKLALVSGAYDPERFYLCAESPHKERPFRLIFCGKLSHRKGALEMLRAWSRADLEGAEFWVVGDVFHDVASALEGMDLRGVRFIGHQQEVADWFRQCDAQILLSDDEGMPKSLLEGAACGLATVCTRATGFPVESMGNGFVVSRHDVEEVANRIRELATHREACRQMGIRGAEACRSHYTWEIYRRNYANGLLKMLNKH
ncbi:MAG: glycosyltransferase family 4 protein [Candidatus Methylacidiphilales bacterium]